MSPHVRKSRHSAAPLPWNDSTMNFRPGFLQEQGGTNNKIAAFRHSCRDFSINASLSAKPLPVVDKINIKNGPRGCVPRCPGSLPYTKSFNYPGNLSHSFYTQYFMKAGAHCIRVHLVERLFVLPAHVVRTLTNCRFPCHNGGALHTCIQLQHNSRYRVC